jgi:hypothetical protein
LKRNTSEARTKQATGSCSEIKHQKQWRLAKGKLHNTTMLKWKQDESDGIDYRTKTSTIGSSGLIERYFAIDMPLGSLLLRAMSYPQSADKLVSVIKRYTGIPKQALTNVEAVITELSKIRLSYEQDFVRKRRKGNTHSTHATSAADQKRRRMHVLAQRRGVTHKTV